MMRHQHRAYKDETRRCGIVCVLCITGCVSTRTAQIESEKATALRGKVVALTDRPRAGFVAMTPGKAAFAMIGAALMIEAGKAIVQENDIPDAAPIVDHALLIAAQEHYGAVPATTVPVQIDTTDVIKLADAAKGADIQAARLKAILNAQRDQCTNQFANQVLSLPAQPAAT
jgi:hypothetical protein